MLEEGADAAKVEEEIKNMPNYFSDYDTTVHFISEEELQKAEVDLQDFEIQHVIESICMTAENKKMTNMEQHDAVIPKKEKNVEIETGRCQITLQPLSFNMVRLAV